MLRRLLALLLLLALAAVAVTAVGVLVVAQQDDRGPADVLLVLGASQFDGRPSAVLESRLDHAQDLYDAGAAPVVLTVGGSQPGDRFTEAEAGRAYLRAEGVPGDALLAVPEGSDTLTSVRAAASAMRERGWTSAVVVTDPWHSLRARTMARDAGLEAVSSPVRDGPVRGAGAAARYVARETAGQLWYLATTRIPGL